MNGNECYIGMNFNNWLYCEIEIVDWLFNIVKWIFCGLKMCKYIKYEFNFNFKEMIWWNRLVCKSVNCVVFLKKVN